MCENLEWRKSSFSASSDCVEVAFIGTGEQAWRKSSFSTNNGYCVETAVQTDGQVAVRDSKHVDGPVLLFTPEEWEAFIDGVGNGEFDYETMNTENDVK